MTVLWKSHFLSYFQETPRAKVTLSWDKDSSSSMRKTSNFAMDLLLPLVFIALFFKSYSFICLVLSKDVSTITWSNFDVFQPRLGVYFCFCIIALAPGQLLEGTRRRWFYLFIDIALSLLMLGDVWHYRGFGSFLTFHSYREIGNLRGLGGTVASLMRAADLLFILDIPLLLLAIALLRSSVLCLHRSWLFCGILVFSSVAYIYRIHQKADIEEIGNGTRVFYVSFLPPETMSHLSPIGFHIYNAYLFLKEDSYHNLSPAEHKSIEDWFTRKRKSTVQGDPYFGVFRGKNLLMIQMESLEPFVISQKINGQEISPGLNRLLPNSLFFPNIQSQVREGNSSDSELMVNTSVLPIREGSTFFRFPTNHYRSLPKLLSTTGYTSVAIHPDRGGLWNWAEALGHVGFDRCVDLSAFQPDDLCGIGLNDASFFRQVRPMIRELKKPFFAFLVTLTSHAPFDLDPKLRQLRLTRELDETKLGGYFQSVHYTDAHLSAFLRNLEADGVLENTVVVILGDHPGVHKYYRTDLEKIQPREDWWRDDSERVPLIIFSKGLQGQRFDLKGGQIDVMPTILHLMGLEGPTYENSAMGENLLATSKTGASLSNGDSDSGNEYALTSLRVADLIIRSNYFERYCRCANVTDAPPR